METVRCGDFLRSVFNNRVTPLCVEKETFDDGYEVTRRINRLKIGKTGTVRCVITEIASDEGVTKVEKKFSLAGFKVEDSNGEEVSRSRLLTLIKRKTQIEQRMDILSHEK